MSAVGRGRDELGLAGGPVSEALQSMRRERGTGTAHGGCWKIGGEWRGVTARARGECGRGRGRPVSGGRRSDWTGRARGGAVGRLGVGGSACGKMGVMSDVWQWCAEECMLDEMLQRGRAGERSV